LELGYAAIKDIRHPRILDVGAGSGYLTACFGRLVEEKDGLVFGIEVLPALAQFAQKNISTADEDLLSKNIVKIRCTCMYILVM
jgi:protein-L-isoaspartate(D-aspartate) O-methyltransferase